MTRPVSWATRVITRASCGDRATGAYHKGTRSYAIDTSADTLGAIYSAVDWDGCIPNWWH